VSLDPVDLQDSQGKLARPVFKVLQARLEVKVMLDCWAHRVWEVKLVRLDSQASQELQAPLVELATPENLEDQDLTVS